MRMFTQMLKLVCTVVLLASTSVLWGSPVNTGTPVTPINVNTATVEELDAGLPNIGPVRAKAIVDYRTKNGNFNSMEDIGKVKGIGPKRLEKLRPFVTFGLQLVIPNTPSDKNPITPKPLQIK